MCIRAQQRWRFAAKGTRMRIPGYPSNRNADEKAQGHCKMIAGRRLSRMKPSRETCLHTTTLGMGNALRGKRATSAPFFGGAFCVFG